MQTRKLEFGLNVLSSYRRLDYTPWHAMAEFVDNSTQSYVNRARQLEELFKKTGEILTVSIVYDAKEGYLRVVDNAAGMSSQELDDALRVAHPPKNTDGRSKYGLGMKTAACWLGNKWRISTKTLGETLERQVEIDVNRVSKGRNDLPYKEVKKDKDKHYTIIEIWEHNRSFHGRTLGKIGTYLASMYREDLRRKSLKLEWRDQEMMWTEPEMLKARDGSPYKKEFKFMVNGKRVSGWVGILGRGSRADAGFNILHARRLVLGYPDAWRPESLYGQLLGSNDLVNQRLTGEIHLDEFDVTHTKDGILFFGDEEDKVLEGLKKHCEDYREIAKKTKYRKDDQRGPSELETKVALEEFQQELSSPELVDQIELSDAPEKNLLLDTKKHLLEAMKGKGEAFSAKAHKLSVKGFLDELSVNDPYVVIESTLKSEVIIVVNTNHPHWRFLEGDAGVLNYLRHCTYDGIAEWKARHHAADLDPDTVKVYKDGLLRVPMNIEMHSRK